MADRDPFNQTLADDAVTWLIEGAQSAPMPQDVLFQLSTKLTAAGLPLSRAAVFVTTLHPNVMGRGFFWQRGAAEVRVAEASFDIVETDEYTDNPIPHVTATRKTVRRRLLETDCPDDYKVLGELRADGVTDYIMMPLVFTTGATHAVSWSTDAEDGFSEQDIATLTAVQPALARIAEAFALRRVARNLLDAYLGAQAGERVLAGQIKRGDGEDIRAVIWFSDLRGSTPLADRLPRGEFLAHLNAFFECMAGAVLDGGGEVLRFIGDSVLAIFPISRQGGAEVADSTPEQACATAVAAAEDAIARITAANAARETAGEDPLNYGIALHLGDVMYGNIGVPERVEFTVIGAAANEAARPEGLCKTLGQNFLVSESIAAHHPGPWRSLGHHELRGVGAAVEVFTSNDQGSP